MRVNKEVTMKRKRWSPWVAVLAVQATLSPGVNTNIPLAGQAALNKISASLQLRRVPAKGGKRLERPRPSRAPEDPGKPPVIPPPTPPPADDPENQPNSNRPTVNDPPPVSPPSSESGST
jgi:hypothetical protein